MKILWYRRVPITTTLIQTLDTYTKIFPYDPDFPAYPFFSLPFVQNPIHQLPEQPIHLFTFPPSFFLNHPQPHSPNYQISYLNYPSILQPENLPFSPDNIPFHFQTFVKYILTYLYFPASPVSLTNSPWLEPFKSAQFSKFTIEDWLYGALYIDFIPLETLWNYAFSHQKKALRLLLLREWAILLKQYHQENFFHSEGICRIPFLIQNNPSFFESWEKSQTGVPLVDASLRAFQTLGYLPRAYLKFLIAFATKLWQLPWQWLLHHYLQYAKIGESLLEEITFLYYSGIGEDRVAYVPFRLTQFFSYLDPRAMLQKHWVPEISHLSLSQLQQFPYLSVEEKRKLAPDYMEKVPGEVASLSYKELEESYYWRLGHAVRRSRIQQWQSPFLGRLSLDE